VVRPTARRLRFAAVLLGVALAGVVGRGLCRAVRRARDVPLSPLAAGWRVGADYPERKGIVADGEVAGEMDDLSDYAGPGFDPEAVHPAVRDFYERTADYDLAYAVRWHRPFRLGAALAGLATSRIEQLNLPSPGESGSGARPESGESARQESPTRDLRSRFARVDPAADPRPGARAWVRTRADGTAVFVAIYAHHERDGRRYVNIAVPLPGGNLSTVLRPENLDSGGDGDGEGGGIELTTLGGPSDGDAADGDRSDDSNDGGDRSDDSNDGGDRSDDSNDGGDGDDSNDGGDGDANDGGDDAGLYLVTPLGAVALPLDQRFRVRPADRAESGALADPDGDEAGIVATHEMWAFGWQFLTIRYAGRPRR
jgi:hypothetical protein